VLRGELSLIGPSPERPEFVQVLLEKIPYYKLRLSVNPGLTGWAQIHQDTGMPDAVAALEHDLYYIKHMSPFLDAYITVLALRPR
jgi:lipopolysaccharide/colanic/teichoic acid biosynthesis glycosyltransferase